MTRSFGFAMLTFAIAIVVAFAPRAEAAPKPGLWKVVTHVTRNGVSSPPNSHTSCVTAEQMKDPGKTIMPPQSSANEKCKRSHYEWTGTKLSWQVECRGPLTMNGGGNIIFDLPEHYVGKITSAGTINGQPFNSAIFIEGERLGDCPNH
jgi:hypothetical protein